MKINKIILSALIVGVQSIHAQISNNDTISFEKLDSLRNDKQYKVKFISKKSKNKYRPLIYSEYKIINLMTSESIKIKVKNRVCLGCGMG